MQRELMVLIVMISTTGIGSKSTSDAWDAEVCGNGWSWYAEMHREMLAGQRNARYLTFKPDPWRGYANQLLGISSGFLYRRLMAVCSQPRALFETF